MKKTVFKMFMAWDSDKEERWLNDMSAKGLQLVRVAGICYTFEEGAAGEYIYRLELLEEMPSTKGSAEYIRFLEETKAEYIGSCIRWVYFRRKAAEGSFDIYSDINSRIKQCNRILALICFAILPLLTVSVVTWFCHGINSSDFQDGFTTGISIVAIPVLLIVAVGAGRVFCKRQHLMEEKKLRE